MVSARKKFLVTIAQKLTPFKVRSANLSKSNHEFTAWIFNYNLAILNLMRIHQNYYYKMCIPLLGINLQQIYFSVLKRCLFDWPDN